MAWPLRCFVVVAAFGSTLAGEHPGCAEAMRAAEPLDVCEVLRDPGRYRDRVVAIRAEWSDALRALKPCPERLVTQAYTWPDALAIDSMPIEPDKEECEARQAGDMLGREFVALMRKARPAAKQSEGRLAVTVVGRVLAREEYVRVRTNYGLLANGYGHLGAFPAAVRVWLVRAPERLTPNERDRTHP